MTASGMLIPASGGEIGGFLCSVGGSIKLTVGTVNGSGALIVDTTTVAAGQFIPIPLSIAASLGGVYATLTTAQGTFFIS
jgi:hypothetical protein